MSGGKPDEAPEKHQNHPPREKDHTEITPSPPREQGTTTEKFQVSKELYDRTYTEIEVLIEELDQVILKQDFDAWLTFLTPEYITQKKDLAYLQELSSRPALMAQNISLDSINEYFHHVVVPSRVKAELEKIVFIDNNHVKAYGSIFNKSGILYYLEKIDGQWKVGTK